MVNLDHFSTITCVCFCHYRWLLAWLQLSAIDYGLDYRSTTLLDYSFWLFNSIIQLEYSSTIQLTMDFAQNLTTACLLWSIIQLEYSAWLAFDSNTLLEYSCWILALLQLD